MKKIVLALIIVFLAFGVSAFIRLTPPNTSDFEDIDDEYDDSDIKRSGSIKEVNLIILSTLARHKSASDCWVAYDNKVYDLTSWLPVHPGSAAAIIPYCGTSKEFTNAFTQKHGTSKVSMLMKMGALIGDFEIQGELQ